MAPSRRTLSIVLALGISASFVTAGYALSSRTSPYTAGASSTEELLREYAKKDTDADGLPDWKEALYGADPLNPRSLDSSMTDLVAVEAGKVEPRFRSESPSKGEEITDEDFTVPAPGKGTVTDEFAKAFFEEYVATIDNTSLEASPSEDYIVSLTESVGARVSQKLSSSFSADEVLVSPTNDWGMYVRYVGQALDLAGATGTKDPITLADSFINGGDPSASSELKVVASEYRAAADSLKRALVPASAITTHVQLVRTLEQISGASELVAGFSGDPLATVGALSVFEPAYTGMFRTLSEIKTQALKEGVSVTSGGAGEKLEYYLNLLSGLETP